LQQGSSLQIGVGNGDCDPAGSQQQQPLQSVHDESETSGPQLQVSAALPDEASLVPELDAPLDVPVLDVPLELLPEPSPLEPEPASSFDEVLLPLLQATSPTVVDAPMTTMTWKSFSSFMTIGIPLALVRRQCPSWNPRTSSAEHARGRRNPIARATYSHGRPRSRSSRTRRAGARSESSSINEPCV
jgi:hypothetical protein